MQLHPLFLKKIDKPDDKKIIFLINISTELLGMINGT
jgi:hypothetical protein